ncbi:MAG: hypothetical protein B7X33_01135 [Lysobacterales bacterium 13-68-4]|nr:MAG: hypothetical protein B7X33_01135 [Xanthomonadales bacterium 13-68-4]
MSIAAKFEIEYLQYLDAEGNQVRDDLPAFTQDLEYMVKLYKLMMSTRVFDAKSIALQRTGKLGTFASCLGHEAAHVGIGAAMTTLTVFKVLSGDPIPHKSERLFYVQLDPYTKEGYKPGEEPEQQLTRFDAEELLRQKKAPRQAMMTGGDGIVDPRVDALKPFSVSARYTSADFFPMFDTPFLYGQGWSGAEDSGHARVAVISRNLNEKLFKGGNSVGREVLFEGHPLRIVGVLDTWSPQPLFYDVFVGKYDRKEEVLLPFSTSRGCTPRYSCAPYSR